VQEPGFARALFFYDAQLVESFDENAIASGGREFARVGIDVSDERAILRMTANFA
jgi:hypothetical protein